MTPRRLAILWTAVIVIGCLIPGDGIPSIRLLSYDKLIHVLLFVGFGALWTTASPLQIGAVLASGVALGIALEVAQTLPLVNRSGDVLDAVADVVGLVLGVGLGRWLVGRRGRATPSRP